MKKILKTISLILILIVLGTMTACGKKDSNDDAQKDKKGRYLTVINKTGEIINEVHVYVGEGTEIENMERKDIDAESFSLKIPKEYSEYDTFIVVIKDRYGLNYKKEVTEVPKKGRTEVKITKDDYDEEKGDLKDKIDKWFNELKGPEK